jgi:ribosome biogenesis protein UTP30
MPKKKDQDETVRLFKEKLEAAGIDYITNVMTLTQLKRDYSPHSLKLKLCHTYDVFLVESKIAEHVYAILGKHFIQKRKRPFQVDMTNEKNMKISIENSLKKTTFKVSSKSLLASFEIGCAKMDNGQIADNIMSTVDQLEKKWPGGWKNISRIYLRPMQSSKVSIPIYASALNPNDVQVPVITGAKQNRLDKLNAKLKKKSDRINLDVKTKKIARNRVVRKEDENQTGNKQKKRKLDEEAPQQQQQQASPEKKKKKKEKSVAETVKEATAEQPVEKKKKKVQSEEKSQAVVVAEKLEKKKKQQEEAPPAPEKSEKKKKKTVEVIEKVKEESNTKKKKKAKEPAAEVETTKPEKKKKKADKPEVEEVAKNNAEKDQSNVKKMKAKKNKT